MLLNYFFTCSLVEVRCSEIQDDVNEKHHVNYVVQIFCYIKLIVLFAPTKSYIHRQFNAVVKSKQDDDNVPFFSLWVILFYYSLLQ